MLRTTPFHRENYSRLIISVIIQFYQRCSGSFRGELQPFRSLPYRTQADRILPSTRTDIVARGDQLTLSGLWAQRAELVACMEELLRTPVGSYPHTYLNSLRETVSSTDPFFLSPSQDDQPEHLREIGLQETRLEMILKADKLINEEDLISSTRKFGQLGNLYQSLVSRRVQPLSPILELTLASFALWIRRSGSWDDSQLSRASLPKELRALLSILTHLRFVSFSSSSFPARSDQSSLLSVPLSG